LRRQGGKSEQYRGAKEENRTISRNQEGKQAQYQGAMEENKTYNEEPLKSTRLHW
jgi:hypothetical protein